MPPRVVRTMNILGGGVARLEKLEMVARWTELPGVEDYLGDVVEGFGKGSLKSFKLSWMYENAYPSYLPQGGRPIPLDLGMKQKILLPSQIGRALKRVGDTLEELTLPPGVRIERVNFLPFGPMQGFPKLRILKRTLNMLTGRHVEGIKNTVNGNMEWDFSKRFSREWVINWASDMPKTLEQLNIFMDGDLVDVLARVLAATG